MDIIKKETGKVNSVEQVPTLLVNDERLKDPTGAAFNNYLTRINEKLNIQRREKEMLSQFPGNFPCIKIIPITEAEIKSTIHSLTPKKSLGYYGITRKILKACASLISHPLSYIYNHPLYTGIFPDRLKIAVVKPLYKKGGKISMTNYRPIPLLSFLLRYSRKLCIVD